MTDCLRDDSTECDCPRCVAQEDRFWKEQGDRDDEDALDDDGDDDDRECTCGPIRRDPNEVGFPCDACGRMVR